MNSVDRSFFDMIFDLMFGIVQSKIGLRCNGNEILANGFNDPIGIVVGCWFLLPSWNPEIPFSTIGINKGTLSTPE